MKSYVCVNKDRTIIFSVARSAEEALNRAYSLAEIHGSIVAINPDGSYVKSESGHTVWKDVPARSLKDDKIPLDILPASTSLVHQVMLKRNILDWMEFEGEAITRKEAEKLGVWEKDTSKLYSVGPRISGLGYDPDTAFLMAKYLGKYNEPPFIPKEIEPLYAFDEETGETVEIGSCRDQLDNPNVPEKFNPDKTFCFEPMEYPKNMDWPGHIVEKLLLTQDGDNFSLVPESEFDYSNLPVLPVKLGEIDMWELDLISV